MCGSVDHIQQYLHPDLSRPMQKMSNNIKKIWAEMKAIGNLGKIEYLYIFILHFISIQVLVIACGQFIL